MSRRLSAVPEQPPRAVLYLRQSVSRDDSVSLELQETAGRDYCRRMGYHVVIVESDPGISGRTWKRPAVQRVVQMVQDGQADIVVLWKWSRLSRSRRDWAVALDMVEAAGGRVESATEPVDVATSTGRLARGVLAEFAAFESERIGEVWREVHASRRSKGLPAQGGDRFGYLRDGDTYMPDPATSVVLSSMYARYVAGAGFVAIADELNRAGVPTLSGGPWSRSRVTRVLDSGFGAGQLVHGRGSRAAWVPGAHPPVVDAKVWAAYQQARRHRQAEPPAVTEPVYVLSGLIRCGDCGAPMHATRLGSGQAGYGYICSRWAQTRQGRCVTVTRAKAERAVLEHLRGLVGAVEDAAARHAARASAQTVARADAVALARQVTRLEERLHKLTVGWTDGLVPDEAYRAARDELSGDRDRAQAELLRLEQEREWRKRPALPVARGLLAEWDTLPVRERREMLRSLVRAVRVVRPEAGPVRVEVDPL